MASSGGLIRLGGVRFQTSAAGTSTSLTASDIPAGSGGDNWFFGQDGGFAQFDSQVQAYQIFVAPVPEPTTVGLMAARLRRTRASRVV